MPNKGSSPGALFAAFCLPEEIAQLLFLSRGKFIIALQATG
jgi:hypothetical protein